MILRSLLIVATPYHICRHGDKIIGIFMFYFHFHFAVHIIYIFGRSNNTKKTSCIRFFYSVHIFYIPRISLFCILIIHIIYAGKATKPSVHSYSIFIFIFPGLQEKPIVYSLSSFGTADCIWSVISSFSNLNRRSSSLCLFYHVPLKRDQGD